MALGIDPDVLQELSLLRADGADAQLPPVGDVTTRRVNSRRMFDHLIAARAPLTGIATQRYQLATDDGATVALTWYSREQSAQPGSAALYLHGGGMIMGLGELGPFYDRAIRGYVADSGVPMLLVDYRVAPEFPHPTPVVDCYAAL
ncbi:MAG: alpha/beta hydrolase, partial [Actinomycetota bacterium]|nr:alpha/beta hydrolase [Actinomycetota bacterium]